MSKLPNKLQTTWNLTHLFENDFDPKIDIEKEELLQEADKFVAKWETQTDWLTNADKLAEILTDYQDWLTNWGFYGKVGYYFFLRTSQDSIDPILKAKANQIDEITTKIANQMQFVEIRISGIDKEKQQEFLDSEKLVEFRHFLEKIFENSKYLLSEKEEKIVNSLSFHKGKWSEMVEEFLSSEKIEWQENAQSFSDYKVIILHGLGSNSKQNFYRSTGDSLANLGFKVEYLEVEFENHHKIENQNWLGTLAKIKDQIDSKTIFITHSIGSLAFARFISDISNNNLQIHSWHSIAGVFGLEDHDLSEDYLTTCFEFFDPQSLNYNKINNSIGQIWVHHAQKDPVISFSAAQKYCQKLPKAKLIIENDKYEHFGGIKQFDFPELITQITKNLEAENTENNSQNTDQNTDQNSTETRALENNKKTDSKGDSNSNSTSNSQEGLADFIINNMGKKQTNNIETQNSETQNSQQNLEKNWQNSDQKIVENVENVEKLDEMETSENQNLDKKSGKTEITFEELMSKMSDPNQQVRDLAVLKFDQILEKYKKIAGHELNAILQHKKVMDELRGYKRADSARLNSDDVDQETVENLLSAVKSQMEIPQNYYKLKAKLMGKEKLKYHERNVEYGKVVQNYTFEEAVVILRRVFAKLDGINLENIEKNNSEIEPQISNKNLENTTQNGQTNLQNKNLQTEVNSEQNGQNLDKIEMSFLAILDDYLQNGKIDVYPKSGKRGGAFMTGNTGRIIDPTFIFLNWTNTLDDVQTFAHEMGHACNYEMMKKTNKALTWDGSYLTMESPSTFMEDFILEDILENCTDKEQKLAILMKKLNDDTSSIFRQISLYIFELELHSEFRAKGYLSVDEIGKLFSKNMANYMGDAVERSEGSENWWIYWSHIRYMFYVYSYAAGLLISKSMQKKLKENPEFIANIKQFYASGSNKTPVETLEQTLGIDATKPEIWLEGLEQTAKNLETAEKLAKELNLI